MYKALLVAPDGEWVTDYHGCNTKDEVIEKLADQGSRWIFYPYEFVIIDDNRQGITFSDTFRRRKIVDAAPPYEDLKGKTIHYAIEYVRANNENT